MFVHEVTGTYLETDNDNIDEAVQTWNVDSLQTAKGWLGHLWSLEATSNGAYLIMSYENDRYLTASAAKASDFTRLQDYAKDDPKQRWNLRHGLYGDTPDV
jgi:hypothetical protein